MRQVILDRTDTGAALLQRFGVQNLVFPLKELIEPFLRQTQQVQHDVDRVLLRKLLHEVAFTAVLERADQAIGAIAQLVTHRRHALGSEVGVERTTILGVERRVGLGGDRQPVLADGLGERGHPLLGVAFSITKDFVDVLDMRQQPSAG